MDQGFHSFPRATFKQRWRTTQGARHNTSSAVRSGLLHSLLRVALINTVRGLYRHTVLIPRLRSQWHRRSLPCSLYTL